MEIVHRITRVDRVIPSTTRMWREQAVTSEKGRLSLSLWQEAFLLPSLSYRQRASAEPETGG
jgi:hypothetical protein